MEAYFDAVSKERLHPNKGNLKFGMHTLFGGIDFQNKRGLDIGGGRGLHSFYAACAGAKEVLCLEPESDGSLSGVIARFQKLRRVLNRDNIALSATTLQDFEPDGKEFDIILLINSINHLDEIACINLLSDANSTATYLEIFSKLYKLSANGAKLIICDCTRHNFFAFIGIRNPFAPTIDWRKHQAPEVWADMLSDVGFVSPRITWSSFNSLRLWGRVFLGNKFIAYFLISHFCLTMEKHSE